LCREEEKNFGAIIRRVTASGADAIYLVQCVAEGKRFLRDWAQADRKLTL